MAAGTVTQSALLLGRHISSESPGGDTCSPAFLFQNISSVMAAFSNLLHVRIPNSYEVSNAPDGPSVGLINSHRVNPGLEYRQHLFLRGPPPGSAHPPRLASSYRLKPPHVPFPPTSNGELVSMFTLDSFCTQKLCLFSSEFHFHFEQSHPCWLHPVPKGLAAQLVPFLPSPLPLASLHSLLGAFPRPLPSSLWTSLLLTLRPPLCSGSFLAYFYPGAAMRAHHFLPHL